MTQHSWLVCLRLCKPSRDFEAKCLDVYFQSLPLWRSRNWQSGGTPKKFCRTMYLSSRCVKENIAYRKHTPLGLYAHPVSPSPQPGENQRFPRFWGNAANGETPEDIEGIRQNRWEDSKWRRVVPIQHSMNIKEWAHVHSMELLEEGQTWVDTALPRRSTRGTRGTTLSQTSGTKSKGHRRILEKGPLATSGTMGTSEFQNEQ